MSNFSVAVPFFIAVSFLGLFVKLTTKIQSGYYCSLQKANFNIILSGTVLGLSELIVKFSWVA